MAHLSPEELEKLGIHVNTESEHNRIIQAANGHMDFLMRLNEEFKLHPPKEISASFTVNISNQEEEAFKIKIKDILNNKRVTPEEIIFHLLCDLTGYRGRGSDERMLATSWWENINSKNEAIYLCDVGRGTLHNVTYSITMLDWEYTQIADIAQKSGASPDWLVECFIRDVSGYYPVGANCGHDALAWLRRSYDNF